MRQNKKKADKRFTYADLRSWPDDEVWDIIDGEPFDMTPAPGRIHQRICLRLARLLENFFDGKTCEVNIAPFEVRIPEEKEEDDKITCVVHPDISIVCNPDKLDDRGCRGAPDLVVEILSPSTASYDAIRKRRLYERAGVKEYWLIDPANRVVTVSFLNPEGGFNHTQFFGDEDKVKIVRFPGLEIDLTQVFQPLPKIVRESPRKYLAEK